MIKAVHTPDNKYRVTVTNDTNVERPWQWLDTFGIYTVRHARYYDKIEQDYRDNNEALLAIQENSANDEQFDLGIETHFKRAGLHFKRVALQGYSQGEWLDCVIYSDEEFIIMDMAHTLQQWWRGDVYVLTVEKSVTYANVDDSTDTIEQWQYVDSASGYYLNDDELDDDAEILALVDDLIPDNN